MDESPPTPGARNAVGAEAAAARPAGAGPERRRRRSKSMHDGIAVWCDCCSCEAEPYWAALAEELGVDLGSDYEDEQPG